MPYYNCPFLLQCLNVLKINTAEVRNGTRDAKNTTAAPLPPARSQPALPSEWTSFRFQLGAEIILGFWDFVGSVRTAEETTSDTMSANWIIRGTEFLWFKEKRLLNYFSFFQLSKVILIFICHFKMASAQAQHAGQTLLPILYPEEQNQNSCRTIQIYDARFLKGRSEPDHWPNRAFSYVMGNWAGLLTTL